MVISIAPLIGNAAGDIHMNGHDFYTQSIINAGASGCYILMYGDGHMLFHTDGQYAEFADDLYVDGGIEPGGIAMGGAGIDMGGGSIENVSEMALQSGGDVMFGDGSQQTTAA